MGLFNTLFGRPRPASMRPSQALFDEQTAKKLDYVINTLHAESLDVSTDTISQFMATTQNIFAGKSSMKRLLTNLIIMQPRNIKPKITNSFSRKRGH